MELLLEVLHALNEADVRYVVIGVGGANFYALSGASSFGTKDRDLFLPRDSQNLLRAWEICTAAGLSLWCGDEPLGQPVDSFLADRIVERRIVTTATKGDLILDLSLTMGRFEFDEIWPEHRTFVAEDVQVPVARLTHIVESKRQAGRDKDRVFLATHEHVLREYLERDKKLP